MAHFAAYIMAWHDANQPTVYLPMPSCGFDETTHASFFRRLGGTVNQFPRFKKLGPPLWRVFEKYFGEELEALEQELQGVAAELRDNEQFEPLIEKLLVACSEARRAGKGVVCTGD
jgi:hypothetical protein